MESKEQISKEIKQNPQIPLWYPKKKKKENMSEVLDHCGRKKLRKRKVREQKQDDFFSSSFTTEDGGEKPILVPAFIFLFFIF